MLIDLIGLVALFSVSVFVGALAFVIFNRFFR